MVINKKYLILACVAGFVISLDQATKLYVHTHFGLGETYKVVENFIHFTYVRNLGAAFGFLNQLEETYRNIFFLSVPPIALIFIGFLIKDVPDNDKVQTIALSAVFGGAIGNYIDRIRYRYVIDFLDFHIYRKYSWPVFNLADSAIVAGITVIMFIMYFQWRDERAANKAAAKS